MKLRYALVALAVVASPLAAKPAARQPAPVPVADDPAARKAAADDLALALTPDSSVEIQTNGIIKTMLDQLLRGNSGLAELEKAYPGLMTAVGTRVRPIMLRSGQQSLPLYRADLSKLYQDNLTTAELREAAAFFRSPEMQAFVSAAQRNMTFESTTAAALGQRDASTADLQSDVSTAAHKTAGEVTDVQRRKITVFMISPLGRKLSALNPQKQALNAKWFNRTDPVLEKEVEIATIEAMIEHIGKTDPALAKEMRAQLVADGSLPKPAN
ncbi:MAG: DUF2059 domain-containing protein [Novosphingobium sp.]